MFLSSLKELDEKIIANPGMKFNVETSDLHSQLQFGMLLRDWVCRNSSRVSLEASRSSGGFRNGQWASGFAKAGGSCKASEDHFISALDCKMSSISPRCNSSFYCRRFECSLEGSDYWLRHTYLNRALQNAQDRNDVWPTWVHLLNQREYLIVASVLKKTRHSWPRLLSSPPFLHLTLSSFIWLVVLTTTHAGQACVHHSHLLLGENIPTYFEK